MSLVLPRRHGMFPNADGAIAAAGCDGVAVGGNCQAKNLAGVLELSGRLASRGVPQLYASRSVPCANRGEEPPAARIERERVDVVTVVF